MPDEKISRELLLQNLIATSAGLLYRATKALDSGTQAQKDALIIESEEWFRETKILLRQSLERAENELRQPPSPPPPPIVRDVGWHRKDFQPSEPGALDYFLG